jgi:spermidine synthase
MRSIHLVLIYCLFFFSGISALILQIAWMYQLSLIFGNASYATATTLATFFMGIAIGGWYWGNKSVKIKKPLFTYGLIEVGIAISGLLLLPAIEIYKGNYNLLYSVTG